MNVYDFDGTIYNGDSGVDFIKFSFKKRPLYMLNHLIKTLIYFIKYKAGVISFKEMKEYLFSFTNKIEDIDGLVSEFVASSKQNLKKFYSRIRKQDDVIISASLDFYLLPLCKKLGIENVICTKYDIKNKKILGENCKGDEKVRRFEAQYGHDAIINNCYGDSKSDIPILNRGQRSYWVKGEKITEHL